MCEGLILLRTESLLTYVDQSSMKFGAIKFRTHIGSRRTSGWRCLEGHLTDEPGLWERIEVRDRKLHISSRET